MRFRRIVRTASLSLGLYPLARKLDRWLRPSERELYRSDRQHYSELLPQPCLCFDVGANAGRITQVLLELGHTVVAFEPQKECVRELKARCSLYQQRLRIEQTAMGDAPGELTMHIKEYSVQSSLKPDWGLPDSATVQVPVSTLDLAIQKFGMPQYCKIDVEGWEMQVFLGLTQPIPLLSFEFHQEDGMMQEAYACLNHLGSLGAMTLNLTAGEHSRFALGEWVGMDEFKKQFADRFEGKEDFAYGDIYVKLRPTT